MHSIRTYNKFHALSGEERSDALELPIRFPERVRELLGLDFRTHQWSDLVDMLRPAAKELEFDNVWDCMRSMLAENVSEQQLEVLARYLTVIETYFFREKSVFDLLENTLFPEMIERRRRAGEQRISLWSAGCSTGEEVYSLAISLHRVLSSFHGWDVRILGSDINSDALAVATVGEYRDWSFRDLSPEILDRYFLRHPIGTYQVEQHIREHVHFRRINLAGEWPESLTNELRDFDLILCRNVLIYMDADHVQRILSRFEDALHDEGTFIPSLTENTLVDKTMFRRERHGLITVYHPAPDGEAAPSPDGSLGGERMQQPESPVPGNLATSTAEQADTPSSSSVTRAAPETAAAIVDRRDAIGSGSVPGAEECRSNGGGGIEPVSLNEDAEENGDATAAEARGTDERAEGRDSNHVEPDEQADQLQRARELADQGELQDAIDLLNGEVRNHPSDLSRRLLLAQILRDLGKDGDAEREFQRCIYLDGECIPAHFGIGILHNKKGNRARARLYFANALRLLQEAPRDEILPECGFTGRQMSDIIRSMML